MQKCNVWEETDSETEEEESQYASVCKTIEEKKQEEQK